MFINNMAPVHLLCWHLFLRVQWFVVACHMFVDEYTFVNIYYAIIWIYGFVALVLRCQMNIPCEFISATCQHTHVVFPGFQL